jgi:protein TonB
VKVAKNEFETFRSEAAALDAQKAAEKARRYMERSRRRLFESAFLRRRTSRAISLPLSVGLHVVLLGAVVLVPLLTSQEMPVPGNPPVECDFFPIIKPPPPPPAAGRGNGSSKAKPSTIPSKPDNPDLTVPTHVTEIKPILDPLDVGGSWNPFAVEGGFGTGQHYVPLYRNTVDKQHETKAVHRVGGFIKPPRRTHYVAPVYPKLALDVKVQGSVRINCTIDEMGRVVNMRVIQSIPLLDEAAMAAVKQWEYNPTLLNGVPVSVSMEVTVDFRIR